jgi:hypothetical protein
MQYEVEKFWPKAKLIAFYRTIDNTEMGNYDGDGTSHDGELSFYATWGLGRDERRGE